MKIAWCAWLLALAVACGKSAKNPPGPLDQIRLPTGLAVLHGRLLVASSNGDLLYDDATGGSVIDLDPVTVDSVKIVGALRVQSFAGELAIARAEPQGPTVPDAEACGDVLAAPIAVFGTRGSNTLNALSIAGDGALACAACDVTAGTGFGDPLGVAIACGAGRARAFFGYLTAPSAEGFIAELDLETFGLRIAPVGLGPVRNFAYDRDRDRLYLAGLATSTPTPLRWIDLSGCTLGLGAAAGGCPVGAATIPALPAGLELRGIALANPTIPGTPRAPGVPLRAYVTARLYDTTAAAAAGGRTTDFGGLLIVLDLLESSLGGIQPRVVWTVPIGAGAQDVRVLPRSATWAPGRRDVVAAISVDEGVLTVYDDETGTVATFRQDQTTGAPLLGHQPFGLAVDPEPAGTTARLWVGSYRDSFVIPLDVDLDAPDHVAYAGGAQRRITGATP